MKPSHLDEQRRLTLHALRTAGISVQDVWLRYFSYSGNADEYDIDAYLHGLMPLPELDRNLLAQAVNELIDELPPPPRAPYSTDL